MPDNINVFKRLGEEFNNSFEKVKPSVAILKELSDTNTRTIQIDSIAYHLRKIKECYNDEIENILKENSVGYLIKLRRSYPVTYKNFLEYLKYLKPVELEYLKLWEVDNGKYPQLSSSTLTELINDLKVKIKSNLLSTLVPIEKRLLEMTGNKIVQHHNCASEKECFIEKQYDDKVCNGKLYDIVAEPIDSTSLLQELSMVSKRMINLHNIYEESEDSFYEHSIATSDNDILLKQIDPTLGSLLTKMKEKKEIVIYTEENQTEISITNLAGQNIEDPNSG